MSKQDNTDDANAQTDSVEQKISPYGRLRRWLKVDDEHPFLKLSLFRFITPSIWTITFVVSTLVLVGFTILSKAFLTNVPLNGLIIGIMLTGVGMSISSNFKLWVTAAYLRRLEVISMQFRIRDEEIDALYTGLEKQASIMDCKNFHNLIDNLKNTGALNVTDNDARMIKSKLGARMSRGRSRVSFLSGLLVMLGLLGTFLGLLGTIDSVGEAMAGMANMSSGGDGDGISGFIASLSAPLQGMGLAFSSSLFGLSGSLLVGTFQYFSSAAQDTFIENFSRWLDEQIPSMGQANRASGRSKGSGAVADDELKAWIVGFIQSSRNAQIELADVVDAIRISADASRLAIKQTETMFIQQAALAKGLSDLNRGVAKTIETQAQLESVLQPDLLETLVNSHAQIATGINSLDQRLHQFADKQSSVTKGLDGLSSTLLSEIPRHVVQTSDRLSKSLDRINNKMARLSIKEHANVSELANQIKRLEQMIALTEKRSVQRDTQAQEKIQHQFRRESDRLKQEIGNNIDNSVSKNVVPFIVQEKRQLEKIARLIDEKYGRRSDDGNYPDEGAA